MGLGSILGRVVAYPLAAHRRYNDLARVSSLADRYKYHASKFEELSNARTETVPEGETIGRTRLIARNVGRFFSDSFNPRSAGYHEKRMLAAKEQLLKEFGAARATLEHGYEVVGKKNTLSQEHIAGLANVHVLSMGLSAAAGRDRWNRRLGGYALNLANVGFNKHLASMVSLKNVGSLGKQRAQKDLLDRAAAAYAGTVEELKTKLAETNLKTHDLFSPDREALETHFEAVYKQGEAKRQAFQEQRKRQQKEAERSRLREIAAASGRQVVKPRRKVRRREPTADETAESVGAPF